MAGVTSTWICVQVDKVDASTDMVTLLYSPAHYKNSGKGGDGMKPENAVVRFTAAHSQNFTVGATVTLTTG